MEYKEMLLKKIAEYSNEMTGGSFSQVRAAMYVFNEMILDNFLDGGDASNLQTMLDELEEDLDNE